jgi:hypothetical protein
MEIESQGRVSYVMNEKFLRHLQVKFWFSCAPLIKILIALMFDIVGVTIGM